VTDELRRYLDPVADASAVGAFTRVKRLTVEPSVLRYWGCTRVEVRATEPPYPPLFVELHATGAHGRLVWRPIRTCDGTNVDAALGDCFGAVISASAALRAPYVPDVVTAIQVVPVGDRTPLHKTRVLGTTIDPNHEDPAVELVRIRVALDRSAEARERHAAMLAADDSRREALLLSAQMQRRRAGTLRVVANAMCYGQLARFDGTADGGFLPGPWCAPWIASTITSYGRMVLTIVKADVEYRGGLVLAIDTDGILVAASPCGGEPVTTADGREFHCLSWTELAEVLSGFDALAIDERGMWKVTRTHEGRSLVARAFGPKRYVIGTRASQAFNG
jgi:hypothetical protein